MAHSPAIEEFEALTRAFSGFGVDEKSIITVLSKWHPEQRKSFRKSCPQFFKEDDRFFERWEDYHISILEREFARFKLLVALVSSYRYEGTCVKKEIAGSEAKTLGKAIKEASTKKLIENEDVVRILSTRSKLQLKVTFDKYKEMFGEAIDKDLEEDLSLQETVQCLSSPPKYFSKTLDVALKDGVSESMKEALTRVIVTRADVDMKEIKEEYQKVYGVPLDFKIEEATCGNYRDFLLALAGRSN